MRKLIFTLVLFAFAGSVMAQSDSIVKRNVTNTRPQRGGDHLMIQVGYNMWHNKPDSINTTGIPRSFNLYFLFDFPFKTNPNWSAAIGAGVGTDNMYFNRTTVGIADNAPAVRFRNLADTNHYKKNKLNTVYVEAPVELRYVARPEDEARSVKVALGIKAGMLLSAHTKYKNLEDRAGKELNELRTKEQSNRFFNKNRISATARIGYGHFSLHYSHQLTTLFKEGLGPAIRPANLGLTISGL